MLGCIRSVRSETYRCAYHSAKNLDLQCKAGSVGAARYPIWAIWDPIGGPGLRSRRESRVPLRAETSMFALWAALPDKSAG
jgi:hypothetical protein